MLWHLLWLCLLDAFFPAGRGLVRTVHGLIEGVEIVSPRLIEGSLWGPMGVSITQHGDLLIADTDNHRIQLCRGFQCKTVAGEGRRGEGPTTFYMPYAAVATKDMSKIYVTDTHNNRVQLWEYPDGDAGMTLINVSQGYEGLHDPMGIMLDEDKNLLYIVDVGKHRIRRYSLSPDGTVVPYSGVTVAGITGSYGNDTGRLDNPTDVFANKDGSLWIADARNRRIMYWPAYDPESGGMAPNGSAEVPDMTGRPYGVFVAHENLYYGDADECAIYKKAIVNGNILGADTAIVAGGFGCGEEPRQLMFPSQFLVTNTGAVFVADSGNDRIIRFSPAPEKSDHVCTLSWNCRIVLDGGNPTSLNMLVIIYKGEGSKCGGDCLSANLSGPAFSNYSIVVASGLRNSTFDFGAPMVGVKSDDYQLCWGAVAEPEALLDGDCRSVPWTVGTMTLEPVVYEDFHGIVTQCVKGALCRVNITAYAMPNSSMLSSPPESHGITGGSSSPDAPICGVSLENTFTGYREHLALNPAIFMGIHYPYEADGNLTVWLAYDFGIALGMGRLPLCLCSEGLECFQPWRFRYHAGTLRIRSSVGNEVYKCHQWQNCNVSVRGVFLQMADRVRVINVRGICGDPRFPVLDGVFDTLIANATSVSDVPGAGLDDDTSVFELGMSHVQGRFQLCYCASYDGIDAGDALCDSYDEFTQSAGVIQVYRTDEAVYRCRLDAICYIVVNGSKLADTDRMIAELGPPSVCGITPPVPKWTNGGNLYAPESSFDVDGRREKGSNYSQEYNLSAFDVPGVYQVCYCTSFDNRANGPCNVDMEFYQVVGPILVRGPLDSILLCVGDKECTVGVKGIELAMLDRLRICYEGGPDRSCTGEPCISPPGNASFAPNLVNNNTGDYWNIAEFDLGILSVGTYRLCYCSTGIFANETEGAYCEEIENMILKAAELRVRGVINDGRYTCIASSGCTLIIPGYELRPSDHVMIAPLGNDCEYTEAVERGVFLPFPSLRAKAGTSSRRWRQFEFEEATLPGHFRVCYCVQLGCNSPADYHLDAGLLFVKGFIENDDASLCQLGEPCGLHIKGYGLREINDTVQVMPVANLCAGAQVLVNGDMNATGIFNGTYLKGEGLWDERVWYRNEHGAELFFDVFATRWVLGPARMYEFPDEAPWAWAPGLTAMTPDQITEEWVVYDRLAAFPGQNFLGGWVPSNLRVLRSTASPGVFGFNPSDNSTETVRDDVLGAPYILGGQFQVGVAAYLGVFRICYCASNELGDHDDTMCSNDDEFVASFGMLVIHIVRGGERYHCAQHLPCILRTVLLAGWQPTLLAGALLPGGSKCHLVAVELPVRDTLADNSVGQLIEGEAVFNLGSLSMVGSYEFCVCTKFDRDSGKPVPEDFFQHAGTLTVAPIIRMEFGYAQESMFNLSRGSGLAQSDMLRILPGDSCNVPAVGSSLEITAGDEVDFFGAWATYPINAANSAPRPGGLYTACLCATRYGVDRDRIPCNAWNEFRSRVGTIVVSTVQKPPMVSSVSSGVHLVVMYQGSGSNARRLSKVRRLGSLEVLRNAAFASLIANAVQESIAIVLSRDASAVSVSVVDLLSLQLSEETLNDGQFSSSTGDIPVGLRVLYNISVFGKEDQLVKSDCEVLPAEEISSSWLENCLTLVDVMETQKPQLLTQLQSRLDAINTQGVQSITALQFETLSAIGFTEERIAVNCIRGLVCEIEVEVTTPLMGVHGLLVIDEKSGEEDSICGPSVGWPGTMAASTRGAAGFSKNPVPGTGTGEVQHTFGLVVPQLPGRYTLCYCRTDGVGRTASSSVSSCTLNLDFASTAGFLIVRGPIPDQVFVCLVGAICRIEIKGVVLSAWDRIMALNSTTSTCGDKGSNYTIEHNPASTLVALLSDDDSDQIFNFGTISRIGSLRICYCSSLAEATTSAAPCTQASDFVADAGLLAVRGTNVSGASLSCAKYDHQSPTCTFQILGLGLRPDVDSVLITELLGADCRTSVSKPATGVWPSQMAMEAGEALRPWPVADSKDPDMQFVTFGSWAISQPTRQGDYRACFCAAPTLAGGCLRSGLDFFHELGQLTVRGAVGGEMFTCQEGKHCQIKITGYSLSSLDKVMMVSPSEMCGKGRLKFAAAENNPAPSAEVTGGGTHVTFDLGYLRRDSRGKSVTALVCYCAAEENDGDGVPCSNATEYTHAAGYLNSVICPPLQNETSFTPPVEDVLGDPGEPRVELFSKPVWICTTGTAEARYLAYTISLPSGDMIPLNTTALISSAPDRCAPRISASLATMNMQVSSVIETRVKANTDDNQDRQSLLLAHGPILQGQPRVNITDKQSFTCPAWEVQLVPFACGWASAFQFALIFRIVPIVAIILVYTRKHGIAMIRYTWKLLRHEQVDDLLEDVKQNINSLKKPTLHLPGGRASFMGIRLSMHGGDHEDIAAQERQAMNEKIEQDMSLPRVDSRFTNLFSHRLLIIVVILIRLASVGVHVAIIVMTDISEDLIFLAVVPLTCIAAAILVQFMVVWAGNSFTGLRSVFATYPLFLTVVSLAKLHIDLWLPSLARKHHSEVWRVATVLVLVVMLQQVVWPVGILMALLRPSRRLVVQSAYQYTAGMLVPEVTKPVYVDRHAQGPPRLVMPVKSHSKKHHAARRQARMKKFCKWPIMLCTTVGRAAKRVIAVSVNGCMSRIWILASPAISAAPELEKRERLAGMYIFMEASGWHIAGAAMCGTLERSLSTHLSSTTARCRVAILITSGLDLTTLNALVLIGYSSRLSSIEFGMLLLAILLGVLQLSSPGLVQNAVERACENITGPVSFFLKLMALLLMRFIIFSTLSAGCPFYSLAFTVSACSVLVLEVPLLAIFAWRRWLRVSVAKKDADVFKVPPTDSKDGTSLTNVAVWQPAPPSAPPPMLPEISAAEQPPGSPHHSSGDLGGRRVSKANPHLDGHMPEKPAEPLAMKMMISDRHWGRPSMISSVQSISSHHCEDPHVEICQLVSKLNQELAAKAAKGAHKVSAKQQAQEKLNVKVVALQRQAGQLFGGQNVLDRMRQVKRMYESIIAIDDLLHEFDYEAEHSLAYTLRAMIEDEFDHTHLILQAVNIARTHHFRCGCTLSQNKLAHKCLPGMPKLWLLHWQDLQDNQILPERGETRRMVLAEAAFEHHRHSMVIIVVIGGEDPPDIAARQLLKFGEWYRRRWGRHLEPYFWIERCCLPEVISSLGRHRTSSAGPRTSTLETDFGNRDSIRSGMGRSSVVRSSSKRSSSSEPAVDNTFRTTLEAMHDLQQEETELVTEEAADAFLPLVFGACDTFLFCETDNCETSAWSRLELALAHAVAPACRIYAIDKKWAKPKSAANRFSRSETTDMLVPRGAPGMRPWSEGSVIIRGSITDSMTLPSESMALPGTQSMALPGTPGEDASAVAIGGEPYESDASSHKVTIVEDSGRDSFHSGRDSFRGMGRQMSQASLVSLPWGGQSCDTDGEFVRALSTMRSRVEEFDFDMYTPAELVFTAQEMIQYESWCILDPTEWSSVTTQMESDRARIRRFASACLSVLTKAPGGLRREPVMFGTTVINVCKLDSKKKKRGRQAIRYDRASMGSSDNDTEDASHSSSESIALSPEQQTTASSLARENQIRRKAAKKAEDKEKNKHRMVYEKASKFWGEHNDAYLSQDPIRKVLKEAGGTNPGASLKFKPAEKKKKKKDKPQTMDYKLGADLGGELSQGTQVISQKYSERYPDTMMRRAADEASKEISPTVPPLPPLKPTSPDQFHPFFHAGMVTISRDCLTAEQLQNFLTKRGDSSIASQEDPNGGMAITLHAMRARTGVVREAPNLLGICLKVCIDDIHPRWNDGFCIGFTAQNPDEWPQKKTIVRNVRQLKRTWTITSEGKWELEGHSSFIRPINARAETWNPRSLQVGDVVTLVMSAPPANILRVLVNDQVVAERRGGSELPDLREVPLWGAVDVDGRLLKCHLVPDSNPLARHLPPDRQLTYGNDDASSKPRGERPDSPMAKLRRGSGGRHAPPLLGSNRNRAASSSHRRREIDIVKGNLLS